MSLLKAHTPAGLGAPSPTPSNSSTGAMKRKRPTEVYSQPADRGNAENTGTKFGHVCQELEKYPTKWFTYDELMDMAGVRKGQADYKLLRRYIHHERNEKTIYNRETDRYKYKPILDIANGTQLKAYFQMQKHAKGLSIKDLKDGWKSVVEDIKPLENKKEIMVKKSKDGQARMVFADDPSLYHVMDEEFQNEWHKIAIPPNPDDLRQILESAGLKASVGPKKVLDNGPKQKKKRAPRRGGKQTNTHMRDVLKDYIGIRK